VLDVILTDITVVIVVEEAAFAVGIRAFLLCPMRRKGWHKMSHNLSLLVSVNTHKITIDMGMCQRV